MASTVFVFEHIACGGMLGQAIPRDLARQGCAMYGALAEDFLHAGANVVSLHDVRVGPPVPGVKSIAVKDGDDVPALFDQLVKQADACLVIAPEFDLLLERWLERVGSKSCRSLNCSIEAVRWCTDKLAVAAKLRQSWVNTPQTWAFTPGGGSPAALPMIVKPRDGAGCEATFLCRSQAACDAVPAGRTYICQPWIEGVAASVTVMVNDAGEMTPLRAGRQLIHVAQASPDEPARLSYEGGELPLEPGLAHRAERLAARVVRAIPGLRGLVGVDVVLTSDRRSDAVIEINPRLTMSYIGLRRICDGNLAEAMMVGDCRELRWRKETIAWDDAGQLR